MKSEKEIKNLNKNKYIIFLWYKNLKANYIYVYTYIAQCIRFIEKENTVSAVHKFYKFKALPLGSLSLFWTVSRL